MRLNKIGLFQFTAKISLLLFFLFFVFSLSADNVVFAQVERPLEVQYIPFPQTPLPTSTAVGVPNYVKYVFNFFIFTSGFIALVVLVIAGFRYVASAGRPETMKDAKDQIFGALFGMLILLASWIILYQINPQLVTISLRPLKPVIPPQFSGILLCKKEAPVANYYSSMEEAQNLAKEFETADATTQKSLEEQINKIKEDLDKWYKEINTECFLVGGKGNLPPEWDGKIKKDTGQVYFIATEYTAQEGTTTKKIVKGYGIFLTDKGVTYDVNQWIELDNPTKPGVYYTSVKIAEINSILPYIFLKEEEVENRDVITYEEVNYNQGVEDKKTQTFNCIQSKCGWMKLDFSPRSLNIGAENKTIVVLTTGEEKTGIVKNGYVFTKDDPNLLKYYWITDHAKCPIESLKRGGCPAAKKIAITYGQIY